jgi:hypothetical protein
MSIKFDNQELVGSTYIPRFVKHESNPDRELNSAELSGEDGSVFISTRWGKKIIKIQGIITGSTQAELEDNIDDFKELLAREEKNLDIEWNGTTRRYVATCSKHEFDRDYFNLLFVPWTAEFVVLSGEGKDTAETTAYDNNINGSSTDYTTITFSLSGSKGPKPTILFTISGVALVGTTFGLEIKNEDTGDRIIHTDIGNWTDSKLILFDYVNKIVKNNFDGNYISREFYGSFSKFKIGTNKLKIKMGDISCQECVPTQLYLASQTLNSNSKFLAQSFMVPKTDDTFLGLSLLGYKVGNPGTLAATIHADSGNKPSGAPIATINFPAAGFGTGVTPSFITKYAASKYSLKANTKYWIVLDPSVSSGVDASNYFVIFTANSDVYNKGNLAISTDSGSTYTQNLNDDLDFKLLFGGTNPGITGIMNVLIKYYKTYL